MKKILFSLILLAGIAYAQPSTGCFVATGSTYPCSSIPTVLEAQAVNNKVSAGSGTTITNAFTSTTGKGNTIVCLGMESAAAIPVFTDADSNTYAVVKSSATAPGYTIAVANNIAGTTSDIVTLTTTSGAAAFACHELKGAVTIGQAWDAFDAQQAAATTITFNTQLASVPGEMVFAAAGFTTGQTVNATPTLGGNNTSLVTVDASNSAVTGGAALAVFYAAHTTLSQAQTFNQTMALSGSVTFSGVLVSIKPPAQPNIFLGSTAQLPVYPASYSASASFAGSSTTDIACLPGNATNSVQVTEVRLSGIQTTAGIVAVEVAKRSTAGSGGTSAAMTATPDDSKYPAAISAPLSYTGTGPTVGTLVGDLDNVEVGILAAATASANDIYISPDSWRIKPVVLRGTGEKVCLNLGGALTGGTLKVTFRWYEVPTLP